ncbi:alpha/beta hydrolase [Pseudalkalibacillus sp. SCS-8]|uniref:alpha/beta hydrolase n=1 Tax=Pseudalkalibacillus nanhaiensis TaxID=3115291 RepID=UPI0032DBAF3D
MDVLETNIELDGEMRVCGTLAVPKAKLREKSPAILIIAGSGPLDRNGNGPKGKYPTNLYKDLSDFFTSLGYIAFRYDKRGTGESEGNWRSTGFVDLVCDAKRAVDYLKTRDEVDADKIIVAGHSEGVTIATKLAEDVRVAGLMFLSGGADNLEQSLKHQRENAYEELLSQKGFKGWLYKKLKVDEKGEKQVNKMMKKIFLSDKDVIRYQFAKVNARWFREHFTFDTRKALRTIDIPILALVGDKDPLVNSETLPELEHLVKGECETYVIEDMEHGLKQQGADKSILNSKKLLKESMGKPIHEHAQLIMQNWLARVTHPKKGVERHGRRQEYEEPDSTSNPLHASIPTL